MRSLILSYIFKALFRDTPLAYFSSCHMCHICHVTCDKKGEIKKSQMHKYRFGQSGRKAELSLIFYVRPHIWCTVGKRTMLGDVLLTYYSRCHVHLQLSPNLYLCFCVFVYLCICVFVYLYLCICKSDTREHCFWGTFTINFSKI